ncbi:hypothetical protein FYK55_12570 [Roseiconus nitratireducens]|uniref:THUMP-like domain-containing protein n=2 Tax=Roseiconus nitratireducens TaxID=2605748 RepID=A0A5M6D6F8_9BACT|nr:hypothetical protein FYK55_12570 [Roseiconus nitratireducens]
MRSQLGTEMAAVVLETARLQAKAIAKLGSGTWWVTERALQQATTRPVAEFKARLLSGASEVFDLCCGIAGDACAFLRAPGLADTSMTAVDRDPVMAAMAAENLRLNGNVSAASQVRVRCDDVGRLSIPSSATIHLDPDRRQGSARKTRPDDYSPDWDVVERLLEACRGGIVKLAPAATVQDHPLRHRLWISSAKSVREQTLLTGDVVSAAERDLGWELPPGGRSAVLLSGTAPPAVFGGQPDLDVDVADQPGRYLVDPDAAIRAAGLTQAFAVSHGLRTLGGPSGFLTGDAIDPAAMRTLAVCEAVDWFGACDDRKLRKLLRARNEYPERVKARGVAENPNELERRYRSCGDRPMTLWLGRLGRRQYAAITRDAS